MGIHGGRTAIEEETENPTMKIRANKMKKMKKMKIEG